ncbi:MULTISPECIES: hypothetical protein [Aerosakkonema]|uniref:hypothetical protein n=1 Tax=Aerosakkonema TaxID=1246629 RepID=UPI0035BB8774
MHNQQNLLIWVECLCSSGESRQRSHIIGDDYLHPERSHLMDCLTNYTECILAVTIVL